MKVMFVRDLLAMPVGAEIVLLGWVKSKRESKGINFLDIVDSTGCIQAVVEQAKVTEDVFDSIGRTAVEAAVEVRGVLVKHGNRVREISVRTIRVIGEAALQVSPTPRSNIDIFDPRLTSQLLSNRHLYLRNPKVMAILRFRALMMSCVRTWFEEQGFIEFDAPILTPIPLYDDSSAMKITVHDQEVFLTQCVGYYLEAAVQGLERVYNMGPSFRGEESRSPRHLMEYHHIKAEWAFADIEDTIRLVESLIAHITKTCAEKGGDILEILGTTLCTDGLRGPFKRMSYEEAIEYLKANGFDIDYGKGLGGDEERALSALFDGPFWITGIPRVVEPFPYCIDRGNPKVTVVADLIASNGYGELLGVAEKISNISELDERLAEKGKGGDARYEWIREVHQLGCVPHAAFGMGVERMIRWLLNIPHVRDAIPFPRIFRRTIAP